MYPSNIFSLNAEKGVCIASIAMLCMSFGTAHAQTAKDLVGEWQAVSVVNTSADGKKTEPFGIHALSILIFESNGRFAQIELNPDVPKFASNNRVQGTPEENTAAVKGSLDLFGTYSIANNVLSYKIEGSSYPNWRGTVQNYSIQSLTGDELKWSVAAAIGGQTEATWKRVK